MFWSAGCSLLRTEGFSCSLDVLHGGLLGIFFSCKIFQFLVIKTLYPDPVPDWPKILDLDPHWNQCSQQHCEKIWTRLQSSLKKFLDHLLANNVEKVQKLCNKGLDPNFHCPDSGGKLVVAQRSVRLVALIKGTVERDQCLDILF
jgi:hypothetical protein